MADAGEIKATIKIEYDGSGVQQAKEDLASLADIGGGVEESVSGAGDALSNLQGRLDDGASSAKGFTDAVGEIEKPVQSAQEAVSSMDESTGSLSDTVSSFQDAISQLPPILDDSTKSLQEATQPVQDFQQVMEPASQSVGDFVDTTSQIPEVMPQVADSYKMVADATVSAFGGTNNEVYGPATENIQAFQQSVASMLAAPEGNNAFDMIGSYLEDTGQSWHDFAVSIGSTPMNNLEVLQQALNQDIKPSSVQDYLQQTGQSWDTFVATLGSDKDTVFKSLYDIGNQPGDVFSTISTGAKDATQTITDFGTAVQETSKSVDELGGSMNESSGGIGGFFSNLFGAGGEEEAASGLSGFGGLQEFDMMMRPIMYAQMAAQMISNITSSIGTGATAYQAQLGIPATTIGSPDYSMNAASTATQSSWDAFSYGVVQGFTPILNAVANTSPPGSQSPNFGEFIGNLLTQFVAADPALAPAMWSGAFNTRTPAPVSASIPDLYSYGSPGAPSQAPTGVGPGWTWMQSPGSIGTWAEPAGYQYQPQNVHFSPLGATDPFTGKEFTNGPLVEVPPPESQGPGSVSAMSPIDPFLAQALFGKGGFLTPGGGMGDFFSGLGSLSHDLFAPGGGAGSLFSGLGDWFHNLFDSGQQPAASGGCFPAGTPVLLADGSTRAIERLALGDVVQGKDVPARITATISFPQKAIYTLHMEDGRTLTLTDSHPVMTEHGWQSLSPAATSRENPDLDVAPLQVDARIETVQGYTTLLAIEAHSEPVPVYNITVGDSHTYYANGVLVHNIAKTDINTQVSGMQLPHLDLSGIGTQLASAFSDIHLPHLDFSGLTSDLSGLFSGIHLPSLPNIAGQIGSELGSLFSGIHLPPLPDIAGQIGADLGNLFSGIHLPPLPDIAGQIGSELGNLFSGIHLPSLPNLAGQITSDLGNLFSGIHLPSLPDLGKQITDAISAMFSDIHLPPLPNIGAMIQQALNSMFGGSGLSPSIPMFASGVQGFGGDFAITGESGPELVSFNSRSVYPLSGGGTSGGMGGSALSLGGGMGGGGSMPQSMNVLVQLDSQTLISAMALPLAANIRVTSGNRSY